MLTRGAVQRMLGNDTSISPTLQVLDVKKIVTGNQGQRYRLVLSDGAFYIQGMLASQCTHLVSTNQLNKFCVIQLKEFVCNNISGKKICVVIQCDVLKQCTQGIGRPQAALNPSASSNVHDSHQNDNNNNANQQVHRPAPPQNQQPFHQRNSFNQSNNANSNSNYMARNNLNMGGGMNVREDNIQPVSSLNPYQNSWKIKVRCTRKDTIRHYSNQKGDGKLFGVDLLDKHGTEIRAVAFNEAADKFYSIFEKNCVYIISKGQVRLARKGFSHITNDYSITLNTDAEVVPVNDDQHEIEQQKYKFIKISDIQQVEPKQFVDVIGIILDVGPISTIMSSRDDKELKRRNLKITDQTAKIDVTLWNKDAEDLNEEACKENAVIALKGAKVSAFGGRSLSAAGFIDFHPDRPETRELLNWIKSNGGRVPESAVRELTTGASQVSQNVPRRTFAEVKEMGLGSKVASNNNKKDVDYFTVVATINTIAHSQDKKPWYEANPDQNSEAKNAKVTNMGDGKWRCEKNGKIYNSYIPRYILRFCATDFTGNIWMTAFNEVAEKILKKTAVEAEKLAESDPAAYEQIFKDATFKKYVFKCKAFSDYWEDSQRIRYDVVGVQLADPQQESEKLLEKIQFLQNLRVSNENQDNENNNNNIGF